MRHYFRLIFSPLIFMNRMLDYAFRQPLTAVVILLVLLSVFKPFLFFAYQPQIFTNGVAASPVLLPHYWIGNWLLIIHIAAALPAMIVGPWLFLAKFRKEHPAWHRQLGKMYVIGCIISAITILPVAYVNRGGFEAQMGFSVMAVIWFTTTWFAYTAARRKDFTAHRRWIMRSYALTFAFVNVNVIFILIGYGGIESKVGIKVMQSMVSWLINLLPVEIYLAATTFKGRFVGWKNFAKHCVTYSPYDRIYLTSRPKTASKTKAA